MNTKKTIKIIFLIFFLIIVSITILYFTKSNNFASTDEQILLKEKVAQEIKFLDDYIISIANSLNNINLENYIVKTETMTGQSSKESNDSSGKSSSGGDSSSGGQENSTEGKSSQNGGDSSSSQSEDSQKMNTYILEASDVLANQRTPDWQTIKIASERLYTTWNAITVDLYKIDVDSSVIQKFGNDLDELIKAIKTEDKNVTLDNIVKLYSYLNEFANQGIEDEQKRKLLATKTNILKAYSLIERQEWNGITLALQNAESEYINIMDNQNNKNQYSINKVYIMIKEFQSSVSAKDTDVLYIKYKNLLNEINAIYI